MARVLVIGVEKPTESPAARRRLPRDSRDADYEEHGITFIGLNAHHAPLLRTSGLGYTHRTSPLALTAHANAARKPQRPQCHAIDQGSTNGRNVADPIHAL